MFVSTQWGANIGKVNIFCIDIIYWQMSILATGQQFGNSKSRQSGRTTQYFHNLSFSLFEATGTALHWAQHSLAQNRGKRAPL
ncbi:Uncharacterised protein [Yersinia enterocolitica]|nr:Uncharacterised protein [Yersinia enterocolitica]